MTTLEDAMAALATAWNTAFNCDPLGARVLYKVFGFDFPGGSGGPTCALATTVQGKARSIGDAETAQIAEMIAQARSE